MSEGGQISSSLNNYKITLWATFINFKNKLMVEKVKNASCQEILTFLEKHIDTHGGNFESCHQERQIKILSVLEKKLKKISKIKSLKLKMPERPESLNYLFEK